MSQSGSSLQTTQPSTWSRTPGKSAPRNGASGAETGTSTSAISTFAAVSSATWSMRDSISSGGADAAGALSATQLWSNPTRPSTLGVNVESSSAGELPSVGNSNSMWPSGALAMGGTEAAGNQWAISASGDSTGEPTSATAWSSSPTGVERSNSIPGGWGLLSGSDMPANSSNAALWQDKGKTWAQAAGKGLPPIASSVGSAGSVSGSITEPSTPAPQGPPAPLTAEEVKRREQEEVIRALVNNNEGWGTRPIDQSTPWDTGESPMTKESRVRQNTESNVWMNEPPNGTGIWESHYENLGERTARWQTATTPTGGGPPGAAGGWESGPGSGVWPPAGRGGGWDAGSDSGSSSFFDKRRQHNPSGSSSGRIGNWNEPPPGGPEPWEGNRMAGGRGEDIWSMSGVSGGGGGPGSVGPGSVKSSWGGNDMSWDPNGPRNKGSWNQDDMFAQRRPGPAMMSNQGRMKGETNMRVHQVKYLMGMGYRRDDAQNSLINNNMDLDKALAELRERQPMGGDMVVGDFEDPSRMGGFPPGPNRGPGPGAMANPNQQMMRQQIMQQNPMLGGPYQQSYDPVRMAMNHRMATPAAPSATMAPGLQQREVQCLQTIMALQNKVTSMNQKMNQLHANKNNMPPGQVQALFNELQMHNQQIQQQLNSQQNQLKLIRSQMGVPMSGAPTQGDLIAAQLADMKLQQNAQVSVDVPEFIPGQPWTGASAKDDPNMTPGNANRGLLTVNNDHLEKLSGAGDAGFFGGYPPGGKPWQSGNGQRRWGPEMAPSSWLIIHSIQPHISLDALKSVFMQSPGLIHMLPNMPGRWVLVAYATQDDASRAMARLGGRVGQVEALTEAEARIKMAEIQNLASRFNLTGPSGPWNDPSGQSEMAGIGMPGQM